MGKNQHRPSDPGPSLGLTRIGNFLPAERSKARWMGLGVFFLDQRMAAKMVKTQQKIGLVLLSMAWGIACNLPQVGADDASQPTPGVVRLGSLDPSAPNPESRHSKSVYKVAVSPDGKRVATLGADRTIRLWKTDDGQRCLATIALEDVGPIAFTPDGKSLMMVTDEARVFVWNAHTGKDQELIGNGGSLMHMMPGEKLVSIVNRDHIEVFQYDGNKKNDYPCPSFPLEFSPSGTRLAILPRDRDTRLRIHDIQKNNTVVDLIGSKYSPKRVAFSPDETLVAAAGRDPVVRVWQLPKGEAVFHLEGHQGTVTALAFSPDGRMVASGGIDHSIRLWEVTTGKLIKELTGHQGMITSLAFGPHPHQLVSGSMDTTAMVWDLSRWTNDFVVVRADQVTEKELSQWWNDLASTETTVGFQAIGKLALVPTKTLPYFEEKLSFGKPGKQEEEINNLIAQLDSASFVKRQQATVKLRGMIKIARPLLQAELAKTKSLEVKLRIQQLLDAGESIQIKPEERRRLVRAIQTLERMTEKGSLELLKQLADAQPDEKIREQAKEAHDRLEKRLKADGK